MSLRSKGIIAILLSALGFSLMNLFIPLAGDIPTIQKSFFRNLIAMTVALIVLFNEHKKVPVKELEKPKSIPWAMLIMRSFIGTVGLWCNFYAMDHLMISDASVLNKLSPFATLIFSFLFLKEPMKKFHLVVLAFAFTGVLFVVKPTLSSTTMFPYLIGILGGVSAGAAYTCVRKLNSMGVTPAFIIAFFSAFSTIISLPQLIFNYAPMSGQQILILLTVGLMATVGQFGITFAYKFAPASEISVFDYTNIIFTGLWGFIFLKQVPDRYSLLGYAMIILAGILSFQYNRYLLNQMKKEG